MSFEISDVVRIERLLTPRREVDGDSAMPPQPRLGETGTVIESLGDDLYLVERTTDDGLTLSVAEFEAGELVLIERPDALD